MPYFDFLDESYIQGSTAGLGLLAMMLYPAEEARRVEWMAAYVAVSLTEATPTEAPPSWHKHLSPDDLIGLLRLRDAAPPAQDVFRRAREAYCKGSVAGDILLLIRQLHVHDSKGGSVNRACHILAEAGKRKEHTYGHQPIPFGNTKSLRATAWTPYKPVAHLWAAWNGLAHDAFWAPYNRLIQNKQEYTEFLPQTLLLGEQQLGKGPLRLTDQAVLMKFLAWAEDFRHFGETHIPHGQLIPTLLPDETWQVPPDVALPPVTASIPPITRLSYQQAKATYRVPRTPADSP